MGSAGLLERKLAREIGEIGRTCRTGIESQRYIKWLDPRGEDTSFPFFLQNCYSL